MTTWILCANASEAQLYTIEHTNTIERPGALTSQQSFSHVESRQKDEDLSSDRLGNRHGSGSGSGDYVASSEPKQREAQVFAQELVAALEEGRVQHHYEQLILAASPSFLGLLKKAMNDHVQRLIIHSIEKDYTQDAMPELVKHLAQHF